MPCWTSTPTTAPTSLQFRKFWRCPPISEYGNVLEIANYFGGVEQLRTAVNDMQRLLYAV